jgi:peroxiredoxin
MPRNIRKLPSLALLAGLSLALAGCSQNGATHSERPTAEKEASPPAPRTGQTAEEPVEQADVQLATAESPIKSDKPAAPPVDTAGDTAAPAELPTPAKAPLPLDNVDTADLTMPAVKLTEQHAALCPVKVGDRFPDAKLPDVSGQEQTLAGLLGDKKLTMVVFWNGTEPTAREQLSDLVRFHYPRFADQGLAIVAINTGDSAQLAGELAQQAGAKFPVLSDADGAVFKQVAIAKLPRTYLLDPQGQILWFDLEYSATTRRDMVQAIRYSLAH